MTTRTTPPTRGALALSPTDAPRKLTLLTHGTAAELIRRAARLTRQQAYNDHLPRTPRRSELLDEARALDALAANLAIFAPDVQRFTTALRRAIELALVEVDEQARWGVPRDKQQVPYARIFATVRGEMADGEAANA